MKSNNIQEIFPFYIGQLMGVLCIFETVGKYKFHPPIPKEDLENI